MTQHGPHQSGHACLGHGWTRVTNHGPMPTADRAGRDRARARVIWPQQFVAADVGVTPDWITEHSAKEPLEPTGRVS